MGFPWKFTPGYPSNHRHSTIRNSAIAGAKFQAVAVLNPLLQALRAIQRMRGQLRLQLFPEILRGYAAGFGNGFGGWMGWKSMETWKQWLLDLVGHHGGIMSW